MPVNKKITVGGILLLLLSSGASASAAERSAVSHSWPRDPFRYVAPVSSGPAYGLPEYKRTPEVRNAKGLTGIFVSNGVYKALYGGRLVSPGDRVGSLLIREITLYAVVVEDSSGRRRIELFHEK